MFQAFGRRGKQPIEPDEISMVHGLIKDYCGKRALETECRELWEQRMGDRSAQTAPAAQRERQELLRALLRMAYKFKGRDLFGGPVRYNLPVGELRLSDELPYSLELLLYVSRGSRVR